ncbi:hypothetical protein O6H91_01G127300 [Diphasiastrum complanatum]|uniref:Uncharacterized protein n=2 Tax=Diphasiastrum complanatum TaxID=34168 RepID=A0ACC2EVT9_DIPCM|nr:hypothetical protein O6H91_01G127300 [Diphasiastrum complanatum]KAJ7570585.1 hypothetical protein O6H91_01G127300 [Diphasiastrum complanatum]
MHSLSTRLLASSAYLQIEPSLSAWLSQISGAVTANSQKRMFPRAIGRRSSTSTYSNSAQFRDEVRAEIDKYDSKIPIEEAVTPPSSWYTSPMIAALEFDLVFGRGWQAVGYASQVKEPFGFFTGSLGSVRYLVCKDKDGELHAFHNVCRHHAAPVASGFGRSASFVCPYHGWTYSLDGKLQKATRLGGIKNFSARDFGLLPIPVSLWGPFVVINLQSKVTKSSGVENEWLGSASSLLIKAGITASLRHVKRQDYILNCNWKVYCDNYLDGGYHVPYAHGALASGLDLNSYTTTLFERVSIQSCRSRSVGTESAHRIGQAATYAFVYPNFMINRYGPWLDTNLVLPMSPVQCRVIFDYFLDEDKIHDEAFIKDSLEDSDQVQKEDIFLCEGVQKGLESPAYNVGRYAPKVELAMHHFHNVLYKQLSDWDVN